MFGDTPKAALTPVIDVKTLHAKTGAMALENDFLSGSLAKAGLLSRCPAAGCVTPKACFRHDAICREGRAKKRIDPAAKLSGSCQTIVLGISRGSVCYRPRPVSDADLKLMHRIDKPHVAGYARAGGFQAGPVTRRHTDETHGHRGIVSQAGNLESDASMRSMAPPWRHNISPSLLRKLSITRPNQVWAMDLTYIPMTPGFIYLAAVLA
ncbi:hypothetical protein P775_07505 [Puniceibacterium antarcticum]|uniref:Uncharacterized protein n=1 Tax=Puniceibacterium antarcticum TaxID=1206336 RepID=A0A2G8RH07_9RHOB|nr:hypothetical protein P775_07505 [Puniceibacterium antarcticum]